MKGTKGTVQAASYRRVSTDEQADRGLSLTEQAERIREFCERQGWSLVAEYEDAGFSARKDYSTRPEFTRLLADAAEGKFQRLVAYDISRAFRNTRDYSNVVAALAEHGVEIVTLDMPAYDGSDAAQGFSRTVLVAAGEMTAKQSTEKSIAVKGSKLERGEFNLGQRIPFGLRWADKPGTALEHDPATYAVWQFMMAARRQGWGYGRLCAVLNGEEPCDPDLLARYPVKLPVANRYGTKRWHEGTISSIFADETRVTGIHEVHFKPTKGEPRTYALQYPPLMTRAEFGTFKAMANKNLTWLPRNVGKGSLLSGMCRCGICGNPLHITGTRGYLYYACCTRIRRLRPGEKRCKLPAIRTEKLEKAVLREISFFLTDDAAFERAVAIVRGSPDTLAVLDAEQAKLDAAMGKAAQREDRLTNAVVDGLIDKDSAKRKRIELDRDRTRLDRQQADLTGRRDAVARDEGHVAAVQEARKKLACRLPELRLESSLESGALNRDELRDLLRMLLPADGNCRIVVNTWDGVPGDPDNPEPRGSIRIEIEGLLPIERASYKFAVLGGAPAVP